MMRSFLILLLLTLTLDCEAQRRTSFNQGWRFLKSDAENAQRPDFDDSTWRALDLPHDWAIEGPFDPKYSAHSGGLPFHGVGWYRKRFTLPTADKGKHVAIEFDGAMSNSKVWLNGQELGGRPYGYIGFSMDLTPHLRFGESNVIAVRLSPEEQSSRWYPGAGIYRNVWLDVTGPVRVARWGTYITTPQVSDQQATVVIRTEVVGSSQFTLETAIVDAEGKRVGVVSSSQTGEQKIVVSKPQRWDIDQPYLYTAVSTIRSGNQVLDRYTTPFGIRTIEFDKIKGFLLNGRRVKFQGVCNHHDLGALGTAVNRRATERQLQIMKSMGVNAIRTSHNPPSPELLEFADKLGLMIMDEAFDQWRRPKTRNGHGKYFDQWGETDLRDMIRRDRNHPSVVMWSIGNEILEQGDAEGWKIAKRLTEICHEEDPTRPTTAGFNRVEGAISNKLADHVDIPGFNYRPWGYKKILSEHPEWIIVGAETASTVSSRGVYHLPVEKYDRHDSLQLSSYDVIAASWAYAPDVEFQALDDNPAVLGEFVWTGFDYLGEPTPFFDYRKPPSLADWPARSSYFGIVDLAGFPKDRFYLYQSRWTAAPMVHILPHWNWSAGQTIPVMAYTNAEDVELFLNGKSLGRKKRGAEPVTIPVGPNVSESRTFSTKYRLQWQVPFERGTLRAIAYKGGKQVAVKEVRTAGAPTQIRLSPDRTAIAADGDDLSFITVRIEDKDGNVVPGADNLVRFQVEGAGRIAAVDNGNPATVEPFQADCRKAFSGMALLIVRSERGKAGRIRVAANSDGLTTTETVLTAR